MTERVLLQIGNLRLTTVSSGGIIDHFKPYAVFNVRLDADKGVALLEVNSKQAKAVVADKDGSMFHGRIIRVQELKSP